MSANGAEDDVTMDNTKFVCLQYPGIVSNISKALETLGKSSGLSADHFGGKHPRIVFRPENIYSRPAVAQKRSGVYLLIRVVKTVTSKSSSSGERDSQSDRVSVKANVLGPLSTFYQFRGMSDFQFLPMQKKSGERGYESLYEQLIPRDLSSVLSWFESIRDETVEGNDDDGHANSAAGSIVACSSSEMDQIRPTSLFLTPVCFSRFHYASSALLCRETEYRPAEKNLLQKSADVVGVSLRTDRKGSTIIVGHKDKFPVQPSEKAIIEADTRYPCKEMHARLQKLFDDRPLLSKSYILAHAPELDEYNSKVILPKYGFYIRTGPWGRLWCKFGYDPRKDPSARIYQVIQLHLGKSQAFCVKDYVKIRRIHQYRLRAIAQGVPMNMKQAKAKERNLTELELSYSYKLGELPPQRQLYYQLCDIDIPDATSLMSEPVKSSVCHPQFGWLSAQRIEAVRQAILKDVEQTAARIETETKADEDSSMRCLLDVKDQLTA